MLSIIIHSSFVSEMRFTPLADVVRLVSRRGDPRYRAWLGTLVDVVNPVIGRG